MENEVKGINAKHKKFATTEEAEEFIERSKRRLSQASLSDLAGTGLATRCLDHTAASTVPGPKYVPVHRAFVVLYPVNATM